MTNGFFNKIKLAFLPDGGKTNLTWLAKTLLLLVLVQPFLQSCNTTQYLDREKGEMYLVENTVKFKGKAKSKSNLDYELSQLYKQRPNEKFFGVPRPYFYYAAKDTVDRSGIGKAFHRFMGKNWGEEPVYIDTFLAAQTTGAMTVYLQNRGYLFATVSDSISANRKRTKAKVAYHVDAGPQFKVDTFVFLSEDTAVQNLLNKIADESFFKKGNPIDIQLYQQEVTRITRYLRNHGYAHFYPQYISNLEGTDSSNVDFSSIIELKVLPPAGQGFHQVYTIGNIYVNPSFDPSTLINPQPDSLIGGYFFPIKAEGFRVRPRTLINSISLASGDLYDQSKVDNTVRQLGSLGVFRPPTIRFTEDPERPGVLDFHIDLTPNKKWEMGLDFDVSNTSGNSVGLGSNLIGLSFNPSLRNRNFLRGAELLVANTDFGIEIAPFDGVGPIINSLDFRLQGDLYFPRFVDYFGLWRGMNKLNLVGDGFYQKLKQKANSRFSSSYNLLSLLQNYNLQFVNISYGYDLKLNSFDHLSINHFGIDLLVPNITEGSRFDTLLQQNPFLENSFSRQFITSFLFRDLTYTINSGSATSNARWFLRSYLDVSGLEAMGVNALRNQFRGSSDELNLRNTRFSHYVKLELDGRQYWNFGPDRSLVLRLNSGIVRPFYQSEEVPYVKQFFVGGPTSIRGWYARSLGPGLYNDPSPPESRNLFYQAADLKFEFNLEYRFFLVRPFGLFDLHSAVFIDGGNIWTFGKDLSRPGSEFTLKRKTDPATGQILSDIFLREMALSAGVGARMDFTYFIFRLDLGTPIRNNFPDPAPERNNSYWFDRRDWQFSNILKFKNVVLNIGLGYPF